MKTSSTAWRKINPKVTWTVLGNIRNSFLLKSLTALSITALMLGNAGQLLRSVGIDVGTIELTLWGALIFLGGYLLFVVLAPVEFQRGGHVDEVVARMTIVADWDFFSSRRNLGTNLLERASRRAAMTPPDSALVFLRYRIESATALSNDDNWKDAAPGLYHADLNLRQYDYPVRRLLVATTMLVGVALLIFPTLRNVFSAITRTNLGL